MLPLDWFSKTKTKNKANHKEHSIDVKGNLKPQSDEYENNLYKILIRQSKLYSLDFSVIFSLYLLDIEKVLNIKRYCGKTVQHKNPIEEISLPPDFHIHK